MSTLIPRFPRHNGAGDVFWRSPISVLPAGEHLALKVTVQTAPTDGNLQCDIETDGEGYHLVSGPGRSCSVGGIPPFNWGSPVT